MTIKRLVQRGRAAQRNIHVGGSLHVSVALMSRYAREWITLVDELHTETKRLLLSAVEPVMDARSPYDSLLDRLEHRFSILFTGKALRMAPSQIMAVDEHAVRDLNMSLKDVSAFVMIKPDVFSGPLQHVIKTAIDDNVDLITRIPRQYLDAVKKDVQESLGPGGGGLQTLVPAMEKRYGEAKRWANQVAMDQTRKAYSDINAERCVHSGIEQAEWIHTMGSFHPRQYHMMRAPAGLNGLIFPLGDPEKLPIIDKDTNERGLPGQAIFCHCTFRPIVNLKKLAEAA